VTRRYFGRSHYEGYNAPGQVIKSGNVKFEPPGGIETASWALELKIKAWFGREAKNLNN